MAKTQLSATIPKIQSFSGTSVETVRLSSCPDHLLSILLASLLIDPLARPKNLFAHLRFLRTCRATHKFPKQRELTQMSLPVFLHAAHFVVPPALAN